MPLRNQIQCPSAPPTLDPWTALGSPHLPRTSEPRAKVACPRRPSSNNGVEFVRTRSIRGVKAAPAMQNGLSFLFPHGFCFVSNVEGILVLGNRLSDRYPTRDPASNLILSLS